MPTKLNLVVIYSQNVENSVAFYEKLGLKFVKEQHGRGPEHFASDMEGTVLEIYPAKAEAARRETHLGFRVDDIEALIDRLGSDQSRPVIRQTKWGKLANISDPDGYVIHLQQ